MGWKESFSKTGFAHANRQVRSLSEHGAKSVLSTKRQHTDTYQLVHFEILNQFGVACIKANMRRANSTGILSDGAYAVTADFEQIFTEEMSALYLLSFLLTGDPEKAEECFVSGIAECARANRVFKEWARSWARRSIIRSSIRLVEPLQQSDHAVQSPTAVCAIDKLPLVSHEEVRAILELKPVERFVFVMSALERYSDHDCSGLLGCTRRNVIEARARALQHLGTFMNPQSTEFEDPAVRENAAPVIKLTIARYFPLLPWSRANVLSVPAGGA